MSLDNIEISFSEGNLVINNSDGEKTFVVADLQSMSFSNDEPSAAINQIAAEENSAVTIYGIDGRICGTFSSAADVRAILPAGIYVAKSVNGSTSKIAVR